MLHGTYWYVSITSLSTSHRSVGVFTGYFGPIRVVVPVPPLSNYLFYYRFTTNSLQLSLSVKELWKSVSIWRNYGQKYSGTFFPDIAHVSILHRVW